MKIIARIIIIQSVLLISTLPVIGQIEENQTFEEYRIEEEHRMQSFLDSETQAFAQYKQHEKEAFAKFRKEVENYWGKESFKTSTKKDWVEYSEDKKSRTDVDFKKGEAVVEILIDPNELKDRQKTKRKLEKVIKGLVVSGGTSKDYPTMVEQPQKLQRDPILKGQLIAGDGTRVDVSTAGQFAKEIVEKKEIVKETVVGTDGHKRTKLSVSLHLAPDHIKTRAQRYEKDIAHYATKYKLPTELVYAVVHTESYFNPKAKSAAPAYGLMQLVPRYGGRAAYNYVFKTDKVPTANYLYQPDKNLELGTAYLQMLMEKYFSKVKDPESRMLCAIAAYNTGAGNVARAFTGKTNPKKAIPKINKLSYDQLYSHLRNHLKYSEARNYVKNISERMSQYRGWMEN